MGKLDEAIPPPPPNPLAAYFQLLCPNFVQEDTKEFAQEVDILDLVQVTFYIMTAGFVEELGVFPKVANNVVEEVLENFQWFLFEVWLGIYKEELLLVIQRVVVAYVAVTALVSISVPKESMGLNDVLFAPTGSKG